MLRRHRRDVCRCFQHSWLFSPLWLRYEQMRSVRKCEIRARIASLWKIPSRFNLRPGVRFPPADENCLPTAEPFPPGGVSPSTADANPPDAPIPRHPGYDPIGFPDPIGPSGSRLEAGFSFGSGIGILIICREIVRSASLRRNEDGGVRKSWERTPAALVWERFTARGARRLQGATGQAARGR